LTVHRGDERTVSLQIVANSALTEHIELMTKENERWQLCMPPTTRTERAREDTSTAPIGG
jgi:hypothetical protein